MKLERVQFSVHAVDHFTCSWVYKSKAGLGVCKLVEVVESDNVGRLKMRLGVFVPFPAAPDFII